MTSRVLSVLSLLLLLIGLVAEEAEYPRRGFIHHFEDLPGEPQPVRITRTRDESDRGVTYRIEFARLRDGDVRALIARIGADFPSLIATHLTLVRRRDVADACYSARIDFVPVEFAPSGPNIAWLLRLTRGSLDERMKIDARAPVQVDRWVLERSWHTPARIRYRTTDAYQTWAAQDAIRRSTWLRVACSRFERMESGEYWSEFELETRRRDD